MALCRFILGSITKGRHCIEGEESNNESSIKECIVDLRCIKTEEDGERKTISKSGGPYDMG